MHAPTGRPLRGLRRVTRAATTSLILHVMEARGLLEPELARSVRGKIPLARPHRTTQARGQADLTAGREGLPVPPHRDRGHKEAAIIPAVPIPDGPPVMRGRPETARAVPARVLPLGPRGRLQPRPRRARRENKAGSPIRRIGAILSLPRRPGTKSHGKKKGSAVGAAQNPLRGVRDR